MHTAARATHLFTRRSPVFFIAESAKCTPNQMDAAAQPPPSVVCATRSSRTLCHLAAPHCMPTGGGTVTGKGMIQEPLPVWIADQCSSVQKVAGMRPSRQLSLQLLHPPFPLHPQLLQIALIHIFRPFKPAQSLLDQWFVCLSICALRQVLAPVSSCVYILQNTSQGRES